MLFLNITLGENKEFYVGVMTNFERLVKSTDAVFNCIPIVNTINIAAQAIYKLAHKVDTLNPVAPGLKTSIKIHVLNKDDIRCFIESLPIIGNMMSLGLLINSLLRGFDDDLMKAVRLNNKEVVHLCLGNNALNDPDRADRVLRHAAIWSRDEIFRQVLNHRDDWNTKSLINALKGVCWVDNDGSELCANDILNFWTAHRRVLDAGDIDIATSIIENKLSSGRTALAGRVIGILPEEVPFSHMQNILLKYSCAQYDSQGEIKETGVLTEEQKNALIGKSTRPSSRELRDYYFVSQFRGMRIDDNYDETHSDTLNKLLDLAQLQPSEIREFIAKISLLVGLPFTESLIGLLFTESLIGKYEELLSPKTKLNILKGLLPSNLDALASHEKRFQLFTAWIARWSDDVSQQAHKLYTDISASGERHIEEAQRRFQMHSSAIRDYYPSIEQFQYVNDQFKRVLLGTFPGCDQAPEEEAI